MVDITGGNQSSITLLLSSPKCEFGENKGEYDVSAAAMKTLDITTLPLDQLLQNELFVRNISQTLNISMDNLTNLLVTAHSTSLHHQREHMSLLAILTICYSLIFVAGVLGNLITCIVISRNKFMHTATNFYLFNLAVSDLILLLSGMPQDLYNIWNPESYPFTDVLCILESVLSETAANATVLTITAFTVERYIAICHPFRQHTMSKLSRAIKFIFAIWVMAFLLALPQAMQFSVVSQDGGTSCTMQNDFFAHVFAISGFIFFGGPMTAICVLYVLIGVKLKRSRLLQAVPRRCYDIQRGISAQSRVIRMLVAVAVAFFICWAPFHAQRLTAVYGSTAGINSELFNSIFHILDYTSGILYFLSTCINPLLYNIMSHKFREAFKVTLARHCGLSEKYQTQHHNYSALLRQNGSMRLHTTVNSNAFEHFNSYRVLQLQCRDPSHHLSLQDSVRTTTTTTTINSTGGAGGGAGARIHGDSGHGVRSAQYNRSLSIDPPNSAGGEGETEGLQQKCHTLQTQISQLSFGSDATSLREEDISRYYRSQPSPSQKNTICLKELKSLLPLKNDVVKSNGKSTDDCLLKRSRNRKKNSSPDCSENETNMFIKPVILSTSTATTTSFGSTHPVKTVAKLSTPQPTRTRLKLSRIISRRKQDALVLQSSPRVELMRTHLPGMGHSSAGPQLRKRDKTPEKYRYKPRKKFKVRKDNSSGSSVHTQKRKEILSLSSSPSASSSSSNGAPSPSTTLSRSVNPKRTAKDVNLHHGMPISL